MKMRVKQSSSVNAFWNASSWSSSSCWMYLSPMPTCLSHSSVPKRDDEDAPDAVVLGVRKAGEDEALDEAEQAERRP